MVKNPTKGPNRRKFKYSNILLWGGNPLSTDAYSYSYLHEISSMHSLPFPQHIFWVEMSFAFGGLWLFVWLLGGGFFVCIGAGGVWPFCLVFLKRSSLPCLQSFLFRLQWQCHEKQALSNELERKLRTQALSQHQETISTSEVRKLFARYSTSLCATFCWRRESAVMPHKCKQAYQQPLHLIILPCWCFFRFALLLSPDNNEHPSIPVLFSIAHIGNTHIIELVQSYAHTDLTNSYCKTARITASFFLVTLQESLVWISPLLCSCCSYL